MSDFTTKDIPPAPIQERDLFSGQAWEVSPSCCSRCGRRTTHKGLCSRCSEAFRIKHESEKTQDFNF